LALPVVDNQFVHKGDLVLKIDPADYTLALRLAQAAVDQAKADLDIKAALAARREKLPDLAATLEERQSSIASARIAQGVYDQQIANLDRAKLNLERSEIRAPVNGWVTNLQIQPGDYASAGQSLLSLVDADSFWVDGYFEETTLSSIKEGDPARVALLGMSEVLRGHVEGLARAIAVGNAQAGQGGLATVHPVSTWVRLAQRVPVRIKLDKLPKGLRLVAGMTASVAIDPRPATP
jgi:RND family efflux transporter MFP subunit